MRRPPLRTTLRLALGSVLLVLLLASVGLTIGYEPPQVGAGAVAEPAQTNTVVAVQGFHFQGNANRKKPARLLMVDQRAHGEELYNGSQRGANWFYDVDPLPDGDLLVSTTNPPDQPPAGGTIVYEFDPTTEEVVFNQSFEAEDTHDVDRLSEHELVVANMRNSGPNASSNGDRLFVYNHTSEEFVWEWYFRNHYRLSTDNGAASEDWTHVNDVDAVGDDHFLASPRNFDQVILINRTSKEIVMRLGADGDHDILDEQHNPDYLEGPDGTPTILVADSENDRIVEYQRDCGAADERLGAGTPPSECSWELVWELGDTNLTWPRDADRLPNGNTLVTDTMNHRVIEVTPTGEIVWETFAPWGPYDAERLGTGDESNGPTMATQGVEGRYNVRYATNATTNASQELAAATGASEGSVSFPQWLTRTTASWPAAGQFAAFAEFWEGTSQWIKPVWMAPWGFVALVLAGLLGASWGIGEAVIHRQRIRRRLQGGLRRIRDRR
jgi:hypothetical protein